MCKVPKDGVISISRIFAKCVLSHLLMLEKRFFITWSDMSWHSHSNLKLGWKQKSRSVNMFVIEEKISVIAD